MCFNKKRYINQLWFNPIGSSIDAALTVRAFPIISLAIDYGPVTPLDATRVDETIILCTISYSETAVFF